MNNELLEEMNLRIKITQIEVRQILRILSKTSNIDKKKQLSNKTFRTITNHEPIPRSILLRKSKLKAYELDTILNNLLACGEIKEQRKSINNQKTTIYTLSEN